MNDNQNEAFAKQPLLDVESQMVPGFIAGYSVQILCTRMWNPKWSQDLLLDTPTSQFLITLGEPASCYGNNSKLEFNTVY